MEQTTIHISTPRHRSPCQRQQSLGYRHIPTGYSTLDERFTGNILRLLSVTGYLNRPIAYDRDSCSAYTRHKECKNVDAFAAKVSLTTSYPGFTHEDGRLNVQLRSLSPSATTNYVVFISGSEFGADLCQCKALWIPLGYPLVNKKHSKITVNDPINVRGVY